jgi:hypothetical protein
MSLTNWLGRDVPAGWSEASVRSVKAALVAFVILQAKELFDAGRFDTPATAVDALLIAVGIFLVNAIHLLMKPKGRLP